MADWAITTYWGLGVPPDPTHDRFSGSRGVEGVRVGLAGDGLWQLDALRRNGAYELDPGAVPFLFGAAGWYDRLWVAAEDVFTPAWNYLLPVDPAAAVLLRGVDPGAAGPGAVLVESTGDPMLCLPQPEPLPVARTLIEASGSGDDPRLTVRVAEVLAGAAGYPDGHRSGADFVAGLWTERYGYVGLAEVRVDIWAWTWEAVWSLSGRRNTLRDGRFDYRGHQWCWPEPVDRPRIRWPFTT
jgi:hypothetical protein